MRIRSLCAAAALSAVSLGAADAGAFCGFYVSGADAKLFNNASLVVMMRDGTRTVLSMQNNYEGPPESFAMVVPVPVVLQQENVKTLPREIFTKIDQLAAPRLVEYWEQDPCAQAEPKGDRLKSRAAPTATPAPAAAADGSYGVTVEAKFTVGEYEIVILSAKDSTGLDAWLRDNKYKIPDGAEPVLRPYVESNMKFFVAKVNVEKVKFEKRDGKDMAMLSPLRFHYDDDKFSLPVRLGLLNSSGTQDLIVHILALGKRYEVANYPNVTIPTNLDLDERAKEGFGAFYAALFDKTLEMNPRAVVTEYAWDASTCDPCPGPALQLGDFMTLGADVVAEGRDASRPRLPQISFGTVEGEPAAQQQLYGLQSLLSTCYQRALEADAKIEGNVRFQLETNERGDVVTVKPTGGEKLPESMLGCARGALATARFAGVQKRSFTVPVTFKSRPQPPPMNFTLTRLHARYGKDSLGEDLVFKEASPITGGREVRQGDKLEQGSTSASVNNFQGRYAIRHPWPGPINCAKPVRGVWGGPPNGQSSSGIEAALDLAFAPRGKTDLASLLKQDVPELKITGKGPGPSGAPPDKGDDGADRKSATKSDDGCMCGAAGGAPSSAPWRSGIWALLGALALRAGRTRYRRSR